MNNIEEFREIYIEFEDITRNKFNKKLTMDQCLKELKKQRRNPYLREESFIDFCKALRNINFHEKNDNYYFITDDTINRLKRILDEVKHPFLVYDKATKNIYSNTLNDNVLSAMKEMNKESYTHIPIYDNDNRTLVGVFSENSLFQYVMEDNIINVDETTTFNDIKKCIDLNLSKEVVKFVSRRKLYDDVVNDFIEEFKNKNKLSCVMVTENGKSNEKVLGIITAWDIIGR